MSRTGGQILVDQLELNGADLAFSLPGESFLPLLDALYDSRIRLITSRHEQGAANAAEAYGKLTGTPGICIVTRGPGATQAAVGVHTAMQDSTPMLLLVGHVPRRVQGREAWQELDYGRVFGGLAKAAWQVDSADRIPEHISRAYALALSGRPGPVVLALPEDVLAETSDAADGAPVQVPRAAPRAEDLARLRDLLMSAERPLVVVGEGGWTQGTGDDVLRFSEANELPVACAFRCQDFVDNHSPSYAGVLGVAMDDRLAARLAEADLVLAVGGRLGDVPTRRYTLLEPPNPSATLVHVHPDPRELGFVFEPGSYWFSIRRAFTKAPTQLYRVTYTYVANNRLSRYPYARNYVYYTTRDRFVKGVGQSGFPLERGPGVKGEVPSCNAFYENLFEPHPPIFGAQPLLYCFAGPRFFLRYAELDMHPLDTVDRRQVTREQAGLGHCNITKCCTEVCPEGIHITDNAIIPMKERVADRKYDPLVWLGSKIGIRNKDYDGRKEL